MKCNINPLVPDAHYSERQDKPFSLQIQRLEVDLKLNCGILFLATWALMGWRNEDFDLYPELGTCGIFGLLKIESTYFF